MKPFHYIDENNKDTIDLIRLFEYALDHIDINTNDMMIEIINLIRKLEKHVDITAKIDSGKEKN